MMFRIHQNWFLFSNHVESEFFFLSIKLMFYETLTTHFETLEDFIRFGMSEATRFNLYFGHGTLHSEDDMKMLFLRSLGLPFDLDASYLRAKLLPQEKTYLASQLYARVHERIPVPYLIREAYFAGLSFYVDDRVLIPRSPIWELIRNRFHPWIFEDVTDILDLCTGSGSLAIAALYEFDDAHADAIDLSEGALFVAGINRERHGLSERLSLIQSDVFESLPKKQYDIILSNPPYVSDEEMSSLPKEYLHEPDMALRAKNQGLAIVEKILKDAHHYLKPQGILVVEVGNSADLVHETWPELPFVWLDFEEGGDGVFLLTEEMLKTYWEGR